MVADRIGETDSKEIAMTDNEYMGMALDVATMAESSVGCVIVKDGEVVGYGFRHTIKDILGKDYVTFHAEQMALSFAGHNARGATLYTTLEPCIKRYLGNHLSLPESCCDLISQMQISNVVYLEEETNPDSKDGTHCLLRRGISIELLKDIES